MYILQCTSQKTKLFRRLVRFLLNFNKLQKLVFRAFQNPLHRYAKHERFVAQ